MKDLLTKWKEILESENTSKIKNKKVKRATAVMLENQFKHMEQSGYRLDETTAYGRSPSSLDPNSTGYAGDGMFHKIAIPMVRRTFPNLIAHEIVGVQPLTGPVGLAFAMRFVADQSYDGSVGTELGHNTIDQSYTGPVSTATGEALGSDVGPPEAGLGIGTGSQIQEVSMTLEKDQVTAVTRKLRSRWSLEVAQDIENMHGLNLEEEMMDVMSYEVTAETDRELIGRIRDLVPPGHANYVTYDWDNDTDGRWEAERLRNIYNLLIRRSNRIAIATRRGPGNWVVADPNVCAGLETLPAFSVWPIQGDINTAQFGVSKVGTLDARMTVYRDTFHDNDEALIGYKGVSEYDTGVIYLPYIQLMLSKTVDYASFQPSIGLMSRYAIHNHLFGADNYYQRVKIDNLYDYERTT